MKRYAPHNLYQRNYSRYVLIGVLSIFIVLSIIYSFISSGLMINKYSPLVDATMEIKLEATTAHLWFEETIILSTGYSSKVDKEAARKIGIKEFVSKPLKRQDIARLIRKILEGSANEIV